MTVVRLNSLRLINWQGSDDETLFFPNGETSLIRRENGKGKSRAMNAEKWLRTGKNAVGALNPNIKNTYLLERNKDDHVVVGNYSIDRREIELKRVYKEQWDTATGTDQKFLKSHTTDYYVDTLEQSPSSYKQRLDAIAPEKVWNLVTDPLFFNNDVKGRWEYADRRQVLIDMTGEILEEDILDHAETRGAPMQVVRDLMAKKVNLDEQLKSLKIQLKKMKEHQVTFEPSIKEAKHKRPSTTEKEFKAWEKELKQLSQQEEEIIQSMTEIQNQAQEVLKAYHARNNEIEDLKLKMQAIVSTVRRKHEAIYQDKASVITEHENKIKTIRQRIQNEELTLGLDKKKLENINRNVLTLREEFVKVKDSVFTFNPKPYEDKNCPTCGQLVAKNHDLSHISETLESQFNEKKAQDQVDIKAKALDIQKQIPGLEESIKQVEESIQKKKDEITQLNFEMSHHEKYEMPSAAEILEEASLLPEYQSLNDELIESQITEPVKPESANVDSQKEARRVIREEMDALRNQLRLRDRITESDNRVAELEAEEKRHGQKMAEVERDIFAITSYQSANYSLVEERVNRLFEGVSFKLFRPQLNGTMDLICDCWFEGRSWASLNTAKQIEAGLLCIKTFQKHFDFYSVIFIDNRESIQNIPYMPNTQIIHLQVPEVMIDAQIVE